jgi:topoisomerase-4 subunit A
VLAGMLVVFLNLDEVIRIIREEDEPKDALKARFALSDVQANYILDTRLRSLRRLEEMQLKAENDALVKEKTALEALVGDEQQQWSAIKTQIRDLKKKFAPDSKFGKRRTTFETAPEARDIDLTEAMIEREPVTVVFTQKGWIRTLKGHVADLSALQFKGDDSLQTAFFAETTSKALVLASNGKVFTLDVGKLPGGRGFGEPLRLMADIDEGEDVVCVMPYVAGQKMLIISSDGRGFAVTQDDMLSSTRKGRAVLNVDAPDKARVLVPADGDHVAIMGENRKMLVFKLADVPEMARGKGVRLQKYKDGGISDARVFALKDGLTWTDSAGRNFTVDKAELKDWIGARSDAGRLPPKGFPKNNKFG